MSSSSDNMPLQYPCCELSANKKKSPFLPSVKRQLNPTELPKDNDNLNDIGLETELTQTLTFQAEVISNVLSRLINEIAIVGRWFVARNSTAIRSFFLDTETKFILRTFQECLEFNSTNKNLDKVNNELDTNIEECFRMLFSNDNLIQYLSNSALELPIYMANLLKLIEDTSVVYKLDMCMSFSDVEKHKNMMKVLYERIHIRSLKMNKLALENEDKQKLFEEYHEEKHDQINRISEKIRLLRGSLKDDFDNLINYAKTNIIILRNKSDERILSIEQGAKASKNQLKTLLSEHIKDETLLRDRKRKLDLQLAQWIEKYDKDMELRQRDLDIHTEKFENASIEYEELSNIMKEHQIIYDQYILEKTNEEKKIFEEKLYAMMSTRAAKLIQRAWRANRAHQKRKKRRGKKAKSKK